MRELLTVIKFTFLNRVKSKPFVVTSIIFAILLSAAGNLPSIISYFSSSDEVKRIGMFEGQSEISVMVQTYFANDETAGLDIVLMPDQGSAEANAEMAKEKLKEGEVSGFLEVVPAAEGAFPHFVYKSKSTSSFGTSPSSLRAGLEAVKTELIVRDMGLSDAQKTLFASPILIQEMNVNMSEESNKSPTEQVVAYFLVYALVILLFMSIMMYGNMIATEITSEKSSRVMEILISSISPLKQMFGKVFGMFLLGISQLIFYGVVVVVNISLPHNSSVLGDLNFNLSEIPVSLVVYFVIFFLLGFFLYAILYAAIGSLVSRTEDLGQAIMPLTFLALGGFYIGIFGLNTPTATFVEVTSYIPFFTPIVMFLRIGMAEPATWEILLSIGLLVATILLLGWLAAKMYRVGVLMYGKRPSMKEVFKAIKEMKV